MKPRAEGIELEKAGARTTTGTRAGLEVGTQGSPVGRGQN